VISSAIPTSRHTVDGDAAKHIGLQARSHCRGRVAMIAYTEYVSDGRVRSESQLLLSKGYEVTVIAARPKRGYSSSQVNGVTLIETPLTIRRGKGMRYVYQYLMFLLQSWFLLTRLDLSQRFDFVHIHSLPDSEILCALAMKLRGTPVILDLHEALPEILAARLGYAEDSPRVRLAAVVERLSCMLADHVICANDGIREAVVRRGTHGNHITTVYNSGRTLPSNVAPEQLRSKLAIPPGNVIVHAGGINRERDLHTLIRALATVAKYDCVQLVLAGDGDRDYLQSLLSLAESLGIQERVHYVGPLPTSEAHVLMSLSCIGVVTLEDNPLTRLAWPTRIVEYLHLGKPLLVPNLPFLRTKLGVAAKYYSPGDAETLADGILSLLNRERRVSAQAGAAQQVCLDLEQSDLESRLPLLYSKMKEEVGI
jgi:glycosyltransferase involved in cell wall biosynthesis